MTEQPDRTPVALWLNLPAGANQDEWVQLLARADDGSILFHGFARADEVPLPERSTLGEP